MSRIAKNRRLNPQQRELCEQHMPLAMLLASKYCVDRGIMRHVEDVRSSAWMGLVDACYRWDERRGVQFQSYASRRILGQIVDDLRARHGRDCGRGGDLANMTRHGRDAVRQAKSLHAAAGESDSERQATVADTIGMTSDHESRLRDDSEVSRLLNRFALHERFAYRMHHGHGYTMKEIGKMIGLSESRVSQILGTMQLSLNATKSIDEPHRNKMIASPPRKKVLNGE